MDMAKQSVCLNWVDHLAFETELNGHKLILDADSSVGGLNRGPKPKPLMLVALAGCTGMDVISILQKMRVDIKKYSVRVEGELTEEHPKHYTKMKVIYEFAGKDIPMDKLQKAVTLSEEKYCGVRAVYSKTMEVTSEIILKEG